MTSNLLASDEPPTKRAKVDDNARREYPCETCGYAFKTEETLSHHKKHHRPDRPFFCSLCDADYGNKASFRKHLSKQRPKNPNFQAERAPSSPTSGGGRSCHLCGLMVKSNLPNFHSHVAACERKMRHFKDTSDEQWDEGAEL